MSLFVRSEDDDVDASGIPQTESNCISVSEFGSYTEEQHANSNRGFRDQYFVSLKMPDHVRMCTCMCVQCMLVCTCMYYMYMYTHACVHAYSACMYLCFLCVWYVSVHGTWCEL